jgi:hypothetical protein
MLPVEQRTLGNADAARERGLSQAGAGTDRRNIDGEHFQLVDDRAGVPTFRIGQSLGQSLLDGVVPRNGTTGI